MLERNPIKRQRLEEPDCYQIIFHCNKNYVNCSRWHIWRQEKERRITDERLELLNHRLVCLSEHVCKTRALGEATSGTYEERLTSELAGQHVMAYSIFVKD